MNLIDSIDRLMGRLHRPRKVIEGCEEYAGGKTPFLVRYTLATVGESRIYLHCFLRSDGGEETHDHPWNFISLILWGGYIEVTPSGRGRKWPGMLLWRKATWEHRVELLPIAPDPAGCAICTGAQPLRPSVSLVWCSGRKREWGFRSASGVWTAWRDYFQAKGCAEFAETKIPEYQSAEILDD